MCVNIPLSLKGEYDVLISEGIGSQAHSWR